jgi:dinuclear metal center YbgI/SA1388 family protein
LVEQRPYKPCVAGSSPVWPTSLTRMTTPDFSDGFDEGPEAAGGPCTVATVVAALERRYPPELAAEWDSVGLVVGAPGSLVERIHFVLDVTEETVAEALAADADFIVAHHPLLFRPVSTVAETTSRGRVIAALIENRVALYCAHTNADHARPGVSDALAELIGLVDTMPIEAVPAGQIETGTGRVGSLPSPVAFGAFLEHVTAVLGGRPVRWAGDGSAMVRRVAVCGGAGDSLLATVATLGVDAYVTADLRHHVVLDHLAEGGCAVIDAGHWATEVPWLAPAADLLVDDLGGAVQVSVSTLVTDPWSHA